ncbi:hypothetical protein [Actinomadura bangladeshensis]|nr:hypothetical protein [Actinomadura bangladeshensis]
MRGDVGTPSQIPGPATENDGAAAIAAAGGLHDYQVNYSALKDRACSFGP